MADDKASIDRLRIERSAQPERSSPRWIVVVLVLFVFLAGFGLWQWTRSKPPAVRAATATSVSGGGAAGPRTLLNASGYVTPRLQATVSSKVTGKVVEVFIEEGMKVESGQILARIDALNVEAGLRLSEAQLQAARSSLNETRVRIEETERELGRVRQLAERKIASTADLDRADAEARSFRARLERQSADVAVAEREVAVWKQQVEDTVIRAPFAGVVTIKNAQPGEMISPMSAGGGFTRTGICTLVDMTSLEVEVDVNESHINRVTAGQPVEATLDSYPEWKIPCKVIAIIPTADRQKATVKVRVGFDKLDPRILPQMGVKVAFNDGSESSPAKSGPVNTTAVVVPRAAVRKDGGRDVVWVVREQRLERRAVTAGRTEGDMILIAAGLAVGERVMVEGPGNPKDGSMITEEKR